MYGSSSNNSSHFFNRGDGHQYIPNSEGNNNIVFGRGITKDDIKIHVVKPAFGYHMVVYLAENGKQHHELKDSITIVDRYNNWGFNQIGTFRFSDGSILRSADIISLIEVSELSINYYEDNININLKNGPSDITTGDYDDVINAGGGNTRIRAGNGNNIITGGAGADRIYTGNGDDTFIFNRGDGRDIINDTGGNDRIIFGKGITKKDLIFRSLYDGEERELIIYLREDGKELFELNDSIRISRFFTSADNVIETIQFYDGSTITSDEIVNLLEYADADIINWDSPVDLNLKAGPGLIVTGDFDDIINAGDGDSEIRAGNGNNIITGGAGNDIIFTGYGDDTYIFNRGDGHDKINDFSGNDKIIFGKGITKDDLIVHSRADLGEFNLVIYLREEGKEYYELNDSITIVKYFEHEVYKIETIQFHDGSTLTGVDLFNLIASAEGFIKHEDSAVNLDLQYGHCGIETGDFDDIINAGDGDSNINAGNGNNIITGGRGNDKIYTGYGNDTYIFNRGDGHDWIEDRGGSDIIKFGKGITKENLIFRALNNSGSLDLVIYLREDGKKISELRDSITISRFFTYDSYKVEFFIFSNGTFLSSMQVFELLEESDFNNIKDIIHQNSKADIDLKRGPNQITTGKYDDIINAGEGDTHIWAGNGNNIITGGTGDDSIAAGEGDDTFIFNRGDGHDWIQDDGGNDTIIFGKGITKDDIIVQAVSRYNLVIYLREEGKEISELKDRIEIFGYFDSYTDRKIETLQFSDGSVMYVKDVLALLKEANADIKHTTSAVNLNLNAGPESITTGRYNDVINAGSGDTIIDAGNGDNIITGGLGNDCIRAGDGDDTYIFNRGDGHDCIYDCGGNDKIIFGPGITKDDLIIHGVSNSYERDLVVYIREEGKQTYQLKDSITIHSFLKEYKLSFVSEDTNRIEIFQFSDGSVLTATDIINLIEHSEVPIVNYWGKADIDLKNGPAEIHTGRYDDIINAGAGDTYIDAGNGDNIITGGRGNDTVYAGDGDDTFIFYRGDGNDIINDYSGNDVVKLYGINKYEVGLVAINRGLGISYGDNDYITFKGKLERIELNDRSYLTESSINYIIQCVSSFTQDKGLHFTSARDIQNNEYLSNLIASQWQNY